MITNGTVLLTVFFLFLEIAVFTDVCVLHYFNFVCDFSACYDKIKILINH